MKTQDSRLETGVAEAGRFSLRLVSWALCFPLALSSLTFADGTDLVPNDAQQASSSAAQQVEESDAVLYNFGIPAVVESRSYVSLYADHKARHVGDIVTIIIAESSRASKSASTQTSKKSGSNSSLSDLFGLGNLPLKMGVDAESGYSGSGSTTRSGSMEANISASVKQMLPNGNLVLEGVRQVTVNDDVQVITVSGVVRPQDIRSDNTVLSVHVADAQIKYLGDGPTAQRPGVLTRVLQTPFHWIASIFRKVF